MQTFSDATAWNAHIQPMLPTSGAFLQAWEWGTFQQACGKRVERLAMPHWAGQAVRASLPFGQHYWYFPKGPLGHVNATELQSWARSENALFIRMEPQGPVPGTQRSAELQPSHTLLTDLSASEETLRAAMHEKTRYNIGLAQRKGVEIRTDVAWDEVWPLFEATASRGAFRLHTSAYYQRMLESLGKGTDVHAWLAAAVYEGEVIAANIMIDAFGTRTYLHGASGPRHRNVMAPYLLHWHLMQQAKQQGFHTYDWWGVAPEDAPANHPWAGITRFKQGFGGTRVVSEGTVDLPMNKTGFRLYQLARRIRRG